MSDSDSDIPSPPPKRNVASVSVEGDVTKLQARVVELETELASLHQQLLEFKAENDQYQSEIEKLKAEIEALKNEQEQVKEQLEASKQELIAAKEAAAVAATSRQTASTAQDNGVAVASAEKSNNNAAPESQKQDDEEVDKLREEVEQLKQTIRRQEQLIIQAASPLLSTNTVAQSTGTVTALDKRKPGEVTLKMRKNRQEKVLAVRAQITAWLNKILSPDPPLINETLMERLATGIIPCNLAIIVDDSAIPILGRVHLKASAYSILAHENVHSFLRVCYAWGLKKIECFSPEDLLSGNVRNRNERLVVETLLSLAKVVYLKFGIEPPYMIKAELDIDESDDANSKHKTTMEEAEHEKLLTAIRAYCQLHNIADIPTGTEKKGQFEFSDGTLSHIRMFEIDPDNADGAHRDEEGVMAAVQNGELVLLVRHNNNWEELHKFLNEHSGGKKVDMPAVQMAATTHTVDAAKGSLIDESAVKAEVVAAPVLEVVDVMVDTYNSTNYEEEDEDDEDEEEMERLRQEARAAEERARVAAQQAEMELAARQAALLAQQEAEEEFQRQKQKNKFANSYLTDADLKGDVGEFLQQKVRAGMGQGDFDPEQVDPEKANFSAIINTSDYKRFKDVTMSEIQIMTNDDLERLAEYTAKQEFFYLTALAVKMTHELSYSSAFQVVTNQELWRRAIEQNIPFHRFYGFITNEITKSYLEQAALDKQGGAKDGVNLRSHRELMIANIKERQKQKGKRD